MSPAMANADASIPNFKTYAEGEAIPPVRSEDIKRMYEYEHTHSTVRSWTMPCSGSRRYFRSDI
jgi:hypothetical protein